MENIGLRQLRQQASELVRQVEAGKEFLVTVNGRPAARLTSPGPSYWRRYEEVADLFPAPPDPDWKHDLDLLDRLVDQSIQDPWSKT